MNLVMIDTLMAHRDRADGPAVARGLALEPRNYVVLTLHRPSNVDDPERLGSIMRAVRIGGIITLVALSSFILLAVRRERRKSRPIATS